MKTVMLKLDIVYNMGDKFSSFHNENCYAEIGYRWCIRVKDKLVLIISIYFINLTNLCRV